MLNASLELLEDGFSIIPIRTDGSKKPLIPWAVYQERLPDRAEVVAWWTKWPEAGIGLITGKISGITVIDADRYRVQDCHLPIEECLKYDAYPPMQNTPRGGTHYIFKYTDRVNQTQKPTGIDIRNDGGYILVAPTKGYEWEIPLIRGDLPEMPEAIIQLLNSGTKGNEKPIILNPDIAAIPEGARDDTLFHLANLMFKGGATEEEVKNYLTIFAKACVPPFPAKEMLAKIDSALKRRGGASIAELVRAWVYGAKGSFTTQDVCFALSIVTQIDKDNVRHALHRLLKENVIERYGTKEGHYRVIEEDGGDIDILALEEKHLDVVYPFEIEKLIYTMPKNIIILAGTSNSGKTAFCLNVARDNMNKFKIRYQTSEMGGSELRARLRAFHIPMMEWKKVDFKERTKNFADIILPDGLNIVDFMELYDEFYRVGGMIAEIFHKLNNGIAIIVLQKNRSKNNMQVDFGLGGERSIEKARLYLAMDFQRLRIIKAKNWRDPMVDPNKKEIAFKLFNGTEFVRIGDWSRSKKEESEK